jgi:hypothetical protein
MKINIERIAPSFLKQLEQDEFSAQAIIASLSPKDSYKEAVKKIRRQTIPRYSRKTIKQALSGKISNSEDNFEQSSNQDIVDTIQWFKQKGGKKWLRGVDEKGLAESLSRLIGQQPTDIPIWNCFDFGWKQSKPDEYPACIINDDVDESIVLYNFIRLRETVEYLSRLGTVNPVVLVPTNEANAPVWEYAQTPDEREVVVNSTVEKLRQKVSNAASCPVIEVMRWDDYLVSKGVETKAETYSLEGTRAIGKKLSEKRKAKMIQDDQSYFEQFKITVSSQESEKRVPYYYGVYVGEGKAFAEIVKSGRNVILLDLEEFRVGEMTALGAEGNVPIISPLSAKEKLDYYRWKKDRVSSRRKT